MIIRVLLNTDPMRLLPTGVAGSGVQAGDQFTEVKVRLGIIMHPDDDDVFHACAHDDCWCERAFEVGNADEYRGDGWPRTARSLSVGDVVIVGENAYECVSLGWQLLDADTVRSFSIKEAQA